MNRVECRLELAGGLKTFSSHWSGQLVPHVTEEHR